MLMKEFAICSEFNILFLLGIKPWKELMLHRDACVVYLPVYAIHWSEKEYLIYSQMSSLWSNFKMLQVSFLFIHCALNVI